MFERSFLPEVDFEFVLITDTHYMLDGVEEVEFESRRRQTARVERALELVDSLDPEFVIHLGDMVQEFPESDDFETAVAEANQQFEIVDAEHYYVAGNHDIGDKPDPTMPTDSVTRKSLEQYHARYGQSWYSWDYGGIHFIVLNSQIMNSSLSQADEQREWLEGDLQSTGDKPILLFLHLPPFLHRPDEPALGHYDNIDQPARTWLLQLIRDNPVELLFAGHSHFTFCNYIDETRFQVAASPSFTRPGFGELFSSCPPRERGRDDRAKLGFYLIRVSDRDVRIHHIRTHGETKSNSSDDRERLLTRTTTGLGDSSLGVSLIHPISETTEVPATFPSAIRQKIHNDYPLLGCLKMGVNYVRVPLRDLDAKLSRRKLAALQQEGVTVVGTVLEGSPIKTARDGILDEIEIRIPGNPQPTPGVLQQIDAYQQELGKPTNLSTVVPGRKVRGKQHSRLRNGYTVSELKQVNERLAEHDSNVNRVLCRVKDGSDPWKAISESVDLDALPRIGAVDWLVASTDLDEKQQVDRVARAVFAIACRPDSRLFLEPLRALDRTMDSAPGLLDRRCNPTSAFHTVRCLNTILFGDDRTWHRHGELENNGVSLLGIESSHLDLWLALPANRDGSTTVELPEEQLPLGQRPINIFSLEDGTIQSREMIDDLMDMSGVTIDGATLFAFESDDASIA